MHASSSVRDGNKLRWDGSQAPFYEVYYLTLTHPQDRWSLWIRYTLVAPVGDKTLSLATVWALFSRRDQPPVALKKTFPLSETDIFHRDRFIQIGNNFLALDLAEGSIESSDHQIHWQLHFEDPSLSSALYPHPLLYRLPFPKTKFTEPRFSTFVNGNLFVDNQTIPINRLPAHQGHLWGTAYAWRWAWAFCNQFAEDPDAVFEGLDAQIKIGPVTLPSFRLFVLHWKGNKILANAMRRWWSHASETTLQDWQFEAIGGPWKIAGLIKRRVEDIVGVEYQGPRDEKRYCHSSLLSDIELMIHRKVSGKWEPEDRLSAIGSAAFETVEPKPDPHVHFVL